MAGYTLALLGGGLSGSAGGGTTTTTTAAPTTTTTTTTTASPFEFYHTFSDANDTRLNASSPEQDAVGSGWTENIGQWITNNGEAVLSVQQVNGLDHATFDVGTANMKNTIRGKCVAGKAVIALIRYVDMNNWWEVQANDGSDACLIFQRQSGTYTQRAATAVSGGVAPNTFYVVSARVNSSNQIQGQVNGAATTNYTSSLHATATRAGIRDPGVTNGAFDYVQAEEVA